MRRYDDPVEVRCGDADLRTGRPGTEAPEQFLWRGRLWKVRTVVAHWVETGAWWQSPEARAALGDDGLGRRPAADDRAGDLVDERELWRVEAGRGARSGRGGVADPGGVFDLAFDAGAGRWSLVGCAD